MRLGLKESFDFEVTEANQLLFCEAGGDINPLHIDDEFARGQGYPGRVVYGMLQGAVYSQLIGVYLPGKYCLLQDMKISFMAPVFIGDVLTVTGEVKDVDERYQRIRIKAMMRNQDGRKVSRALIDVGLSK